MTDVRSWARKLACVFFLFSGCGREAVAGETFCDDLAPGDIVITEVSANPDGSDGTNEYIELFNAASSSISLDGLTLNASRSDGASMETHRFEGASIDAGRYFVVGNAPLDAMPEHIDYSFGNTLGSLRNSDAAISIRCGGALIDQVTYARTVDGRALELDGRLAPDHELNDDEGHWCTTPEGVREVWPGNFGTPGVANSPCEVLQLDGVCRAGGSSRSIITPAHGDLRITEWMANPAGPDADFEWVELLFLTDADLNGLQLGPDAESLDAIVEGEECLPVAAGSRVVFGASPAAAPRVGAELGFNLGNTGPRSIVAAIDGVVLDRVDYTDTVEGVSWQLDADDATCLALSRDEYAVGNFGTPGEANPTCAPVLGPGMCFEEGIPRAIVRAEPGDARFTEWMANPSRVGNREGEWVELRFDSAIDLNGLVVSDLTSTTMVVEDDECLSVEPGAHAVFARSTNPAKNGGILHVDAELSLSLNNSDETLTLSIGDVILDSVTYEDSTPGTATQIDELGEVCDATAQYGDGDLGTPGSANPRCS